MVFRVPPLSRLTGRRPAALLSTLVCALILSGCQSAPIPAGLAQVSASILVEEASAPGASIARQSSLYSQIQQRDFEAFGAGRYPDDASGSFQAQAYARAEARRAALRELARQIIQFGEEGESALIQILGDEEGWESTLEASLEKRAVIDYKTRDNLELARARIPGAQIFTGPAAPGSAGHEIHDAGETELEFLARRRKAEAAATEAARTFLYEDLLPYGGRTNFFGVPIPPSSSYKEALREEIKHVPPYEVEYTEEGECIVTLQYDRSALRRLHD